MKKLLLIVLCILLLPLPAYAMGQDVFANGQYVDRGMGAFNDYYGGTVLHIPALATARVRCAGLRRWLLGNHWWKICRCF